MKTFNSLRKKLFAATSLLLAAGAFTFGSPAHAQLSCEELFRTHDLNAVAARADSDAARRSRAVLGMFEDRTPEQWLRILQTSGKLIHSGRHRYHSDSAFIASNEFDWHKTPFDGRATDLMIAFGTNSAWEIAVNKSAKNLIMADWSPEPILAHALIFTPLMKIAKTPQELLYLLAGRTPEGAKNQSVGLLMKQFGARFEMTYDQVENLLRYLDARAEITDTELEFLAEYYYSRLPLHPMLEFQQMLGVGGPLPGPFGLLRGRSFSNLVGFLDARYQATPQANLADSVLHNRTNFAKLRAMYIDGRITYAHTEIADPLFYAKVQAKFPTAVSWTLSVSNIFDMNYNGHSFQSFQRYLQSVVTTASISPSTLKSLTVFRTVNFQSPHGFYRYDISGAADIPKLDEVDSQAAQERMPRSSGF